MPLLLRNRKKDKSWDTTDRILLSISLAAAVIAIVLMLLP